MALVAGSFRCASCKVCGGIPREQNVAAVGVVIFLWSHCDRESALALRAP